MTGLTDQDVIDLYRCLLGRAPENADTIAAFRHYYPDFDTGRRAILTSDEFRDYAAAVTGAVPDRGDVASPLALKLLMQASGTRMPTIHDQALRDGMALQLGRLGQARLALVIGDDPPDLPLDDLLPLGGPSAAVLQRAATPRPLAAATLADGTVLLTGPWQPASLVEMLAHLGQRIDALILLGPPAEAAQAAMLDLLAPRALVAVSDTAPGSEALNAMVARHRKAGPPIGWEPPLAWHGLSLHHVGAWLLPVTYTPRACSLPDAETYPALAVAAIVRNESACVENMLRSALPFASFYAVLDTGSQDGTQALVQAFLASAKVPSAFAHVGRQQFDDHFGAMRNAALDMVPDWVEWVLMLDADEEMAAEDAEPLLRLIAAGTHDAYALPRYNYRGQDKSGEVTPYPDRQVRLLRHGRGPRPRYSGAVHETVRDVPLGMPPLDATALGGSPGGPHIHHLVRRFRDGEAEDRKQAFYRDVARRHGLG